MIGKVIPKTGFRRPRKAKLSYFAGVKIAGVW
jgi:hypothetical protein